MSLREPRFEVAEDDRPHTLKVWLAGTIKQKIISGEYSPGALLDSERRLSKKYGISRATVRGSLDLLDRDGFVHRYARQGVVIAERSAVPERDSVPRKAAGKMLFLRRRDDLLACEASIGIDRFCKENGLEYSCLASHGSDRRFFSYLRHIPKGVGGVLLFPLGTPRYLAAIKEMIKAGVRVVCLDRMVEGMEVSSVSVDYFNGMLQATNHLFEMWSRPVHYIGYRQGNSALITMLAGWRSSLANHGIGDWERYFVEIREPETKFWDSTYETYARAGYELSRKLFSSKPPAHSGWSILAINDFTAHGVYQAAEEMGLQIGQDVAIVGFDDLPLARRLSPALSSITYPREELGYCGARILAERMKEECERMISEILQVKLIVRESSSGQAAVSKRGQGVVEVATMKQEV